METKSFKEIQLENKAPLQFAIYKGVTGKFGAVRINLKKAYTDDRRGKPNGCVFLDMAPPLAANDYDWKNSKITIALSITDISKIILFLRSPKHPMFNDRDNPGNHILKIYHDKGAGSIDKGKTVTSLNFSKDDNKNNIFISGFQRNESIQKKASVPISPDEVISMGTLLQAAIPLILAWA